MRPTNDARSDATRNRRSALIAQLIRARARVVITAEAIEAGQPLNADLLRHALEMARCEDQLSNFDLGRAN